MALNDLGEQTRRLSRIVRKVDNNRLQKRRAALPLEQWRRQANKILRESDDPKAVAAASAFLAVDEILAGDYTVREGGGAATKPMPLPKELQPYAAQWKRPPPENP